MTTTQIIANAETQLIGLQDELERLTALRLAATGDTWTLDCDIEECERSMAYYAMLRDTNGLPLTLGDEPE